MKRFLFALLLALPLSAQTTATVFVTSQQNTGSGVFPFGAQQLSIDFDSGAGFGASVSRGIGHWSGELAVFRTSSSGSLRSNGTSVFDLGDLELTPITAMVRYDFRHGYVGAGAAYVMTSDLDTEDTTVSLDDSIEPVIGAGLTYDFSRRLGAVLDLRYIPMTISGQPDPADPRIAADINPLLVSAGLRIRF
ncbi:MAG TPA: OmpW family outer membrane protein [Thermoanaerobaculia bacterium]|nr:OmpW family outer membrane protein [Thermoanaerobaculia bacterium]